jgi:uncharacterized protein (TIGR00369 family)
MQVPPNSDLLLGAVCVDKTNPGKTAWSMTADERFANPAGLLQGGFLCAFVDTALGSAAVTFVEGRPVFALSAELKVSFLAPVPLPARLRCEAQVVSGGSRIAFVEATVTREDGTVVARASSTYAYRDREGSRAGAGAPRE